MASAQVYRFQQRISNLQSHHKLASIRHCEAVSNYISQNNELMKSLMAHLKGPDKSVKRTKRITKPRTTHPQLAKSARFSAKSYAMQSTVEQLNAIHHHSLYRQKNFVNQCLPEETWNNFGTPATNDDPSVCNSKEPIFPPPTYTEPSLNCEPRILDDCLWEIWNGDNNVLQSKHQMRTQTSYTSCDKIYSGDTPSSIYNGAQEKQYWSRDDVSLDIKQQTLSRIPGYNIPAAQPRDSYWLKQSTSYGEPKHLLLVNKHDNLYRNEPLSTAQNPFSHNLNVSCRNSNSLLTNQMTNYSAEFCTSNSSYELTGSSKNHINPILVSTYPSVGSDINSCRSAIFDPDECFRPYYDCTSYHPSGSNNNGSSSGGDNSSTSNYHFYRADLSALQS
ncbi:unnamed protein product [Schistosoma guineensis]|uniref:Uncharacterized protein n=2 Tax=Schistosoma TaxID=6181 RepID=A0A430QMS5_SCHBO|nr:hypothetical protein MS3_00008092 [Schistosoma haematobium]RTG89000.1 uncharacterized protein DC041_0012268 [Schistosoma bovis]CAH8560057.1 unnamed protein product [Schistosoma guineensis]KAH9583801.1 hypothetical protein MS3_00008092 [Schistosoma haematobium]CAH8562773.1 unnamed protein product [Schistosoma bovis]CAH8565964.1 unnamed protein product [Schistosoma bovis]